MSFRSSRNRSTSFLHKMASSIIRTGCCYILVLCQLPTPAQVAAYSDLLHPSQTTAAFSFAGPGIFSLLGRHSRELRTRLRFADPPALLVNTKFREEADIIFRASRNISSATPVLEEQPIGMHYLNKVAQFTTRAQITDAFVSKVQQNATLARSIVRRLSNFSASVGDAFVWVGGEASVFLLGRSKVFTVVQSCSSLRVFDESGEPRDNFHFLFVRSHPPFRSHVLTMRGKHAPVACGGSGLVFDDHTENSQRLWRVASNSNMRPLESVGVINPGDLNSGNGILALSDEQLQALRRQQDETAGVMSVPGGALSTGLGAVQREYERGLEQYNNMGFLILSVSAILSSTAVASLASGALRERLIIVMVESAVVYSFLAILSHSCLVFTRRNTFVVDSSTVVRGNYTYHGAVVESMMRINFTAVGQREGLPNLLLVTWGCVLLASFIVTVTGANLFRQIRAKRKEATPKTSICEDLSEYENELEKRNFTF